MNINFHNWLLLREKDIDAMVELFVNKRNYHFEFDYDKQKNSLRVTIVIEE